MNELRNKTWLRFAKEYDEKKRCVDATKANYPWKEQEKKNFSVAFALIVVRVWSACKHFFFYTHCVVYTHIALNVYAAQSYNNKIKFEYNEKH